VRVAAIGKAAPAMVRGAADALGAQLLGGVVVSDHAERVPAGMRLVIGGHPFPDHRSEAAGYALLAEAYVTAPRETLLVLVSGGGSALAEVPPVAVTIEDLAATQYALLHGGVPIDEVNTVRRHCSRLKNGALVARSGAGRVITLLVSDVTGTPATTIASGPTLADATSAEDALVILDRHGLRASVPRAVIEHLERGAFPAAPGPPHLWEVVADGATALAAAERELRRAGYETNSFGSALGGEAAEAARRMVAAATAEQVDLICGETTVTVRGNGRGGRNQSGALAAALLLEGETAVFGAFATDGIDGPTDAAGAIVDGATVRRARSAGLDPAGRLADDDAYPVLAATGDLVVTGPTGTNVADLWMCWRG
jgi:glycerate-2-kinase